MTGTLDVRDRVLAKIVMGELIGERIEIIKSVRPELQKIRGKIIDESLKTFKIENKKGVKIIPKKLCMFRFKVKGKVREIDGNHLMFRPEDRIKKYWRKFDGTMRR